MRYITAHEWEKCRAVLGIIRAIYSRAVSSLIQSSDRFGFFGRGLICRSGMEVLLNVGQLANYDVRLNAPMRAIGISRRRRNVFVRRIGRRRKQKSCSTLPLLLPFPTSQTCMKRAHDMALEKGKGVCYFGQLINARQEKVMKELKKSIA